jgi:hypothetical protein
VFVGRVWRVAALGWGGVGGVLTFDPAGVVGRLPTLRAIELCVARLFIDIELGFQYIGGAHEFEIFSDYHRGE